MNIINPIIATQRDLAQLVISYAACFPMIDLFTRLSNGEPVYFYEHEEIIPVNNPDYTTLFCHWHEQNAQDFIENFHVEPLQKQEVWKAEALTRSIFEELLGKPFPKLRPSWLKAGRHQASLELDGYCEELRLAFEYQGEYHYMEIPVYYQQRSLKEVQKNDELKLKRCQSQGVDLIQVPYWEKGNREFIKKALLELNRPEISQVLR